MLAYHDLLQILLERGKPRADRTGVGTLSLFGHQMRFDLSEGFPLVTSKKVHFRSVAYELLWFLGGHTDAQWLQERRVTIWDEWATAEQCARFGREPGDLGPIYGHQWRNFGASKDEAGKYRNDGCDQITKLIETIRRDPTSRRLIVSGWNPREADEVALPPCHTLFQFYVQEGRLSAQLYQRSADAFLGLPFNIASYALLTCMVAEVCDLQRGDFVHSLGDVHLYRNHVEQAQMQLQRELRPLPQLRFRRKVESIFDFQFEDIELLGYEPHPAIPAPVAV